MKKTLVILLLIGSTSSFAQTYFPFPDSVGVWREIAVSGDPIFNPPETNSPYAYFLNGDTTINSNTYNKLYLYNCYSIYVWTTTPVPIPACLNIDTLNATYFGALREVNKKIYFRPDTNYNYSFCPDIGSGPYTTTYNQDLLLYDFNVIVGDTVLYPHLDSTKIIISSIDSILVQSQYRKKYNYNILMNGLPCGIMSGFNYVEGIGDITGGLFSLWIYYFENANGLMCFEDDEVSYSNVSDCMTVGINTIRNSELFELYPNPASNKLFIELEYPTRTKVLVYNISGKEVYSSFINQSKSIIDVSSYKSGLYLVKVIDENGISKSKLISIH